MPLMMLNESQSPCPTGRFPALAVRSLHPRALWLVAPRVLTALVVWGQVSDLPWSTEFITLWNHRGTGISMDVLLSRVVLMSKGRRKKLLAFEAIQKRGIQQLRELFSNSLLLISLLAMERLCQ